MSCLRSLIKVISFKIKSIVRCQKLLGLDFRSFPGRDKVYSRRCRCFSPVTYLGSKFPGRDVGGKHTTSAGTVPTMALKLLKSCSALDQSGSAKAKT